MKNPKRFTELFNRRIDWVLYALPMLLVCTIALLAYWPGTLGSDAKSLWWQITYKQFDDWQPAGFTLYLAMLYKIRATPGLPVFLNIVILSLAFAWSLKALEELHVAKRWLWLLSIIAALWPTNVMLSISLLKDVPFSALLLILSVVFFKIIVTKGEYIQQKWFWIWFGILIGSISLLRHNGILELAGLVIVLIGLYYRYWKPLVRSSIVAILLISFVQGPLYSYFNVTHVSQALTRVLSLNIIAAFINQGYSFDAQEESFLNQLTPNWQRYSCCNVDPIYWDDHFRRSLFRENLDKIDNLFLELILAKPGVAINHMFCSSSYIWNPVGCSTIWTNYFPYSEDGKIQWLFSGGHNFQFAESKLPALVMPIFNIFIKTWQSPTLFNVFWTPSILLWLSLAFTGILVHKLKSLRYFLVATPLIIHSLVGMIAIPAPDYRYQMFISLYFLFSLGFLFIPAAQNS